MGRSSDKSIKKFTSRMQARLLLVFCVITLLMVGLMGRLIYIMQTDGERYAKHVLSRQSYVSAVLPYKRGEIQDRNGTVLARSELQYKLVLDSKLLLDNKKYIAPTLKALKDNFAIENDVIQAIFNEKPDSHYVIVRKNLEYEVVQKFKETVEKEDNVIGVWFEEEYVRTYPLNTLASDVIGFTSTDNTGYFGIEEYYNNELNGTNGREYGYYDSDLNIERIVKKAVNGNTIVTSIDTNIQRIIQKHILQFNTEFGSKSIGVLVMNPNNGEVIAMASNKEYNLNEPRNLDGIYTEAELASMTEEQKTEALNALWKNDVISSGFEPGSTFKPMTIASALEEAIAKPEDTYYCDGGEHVGGSHIKCSKRTGHGELTLGQALMVSCNDALMQIVAKEGRDIFYQYQNSFGFNKKTGIDLPGEEAGITIALDKLNSTELATSSFGQSFNSTMIQMAAAYSSLVNGGYYYQPHVAKRIVNDNGATVKEYNESLIRQTVSKETSEFIQEYMYKTVEEGTAQGAKVEGYAIGGKTGTAQKYPRAAKTYVVSFLGAVPAINPEIVIYVIIDEPQNVVKQADSSIATKFASRIMTEILPALNIFPEGEINYLLPSEEEENGLNGDTTPNSSNTTNNNQNTQKPSGQNNTQNEAPDTATPDTQAPEDAQDENEETSAEQDSTNQTTQNNEEQQEVDNEDTEETQSNEDNTDTTDTTNQAGNAEDGLAEDEFNPDALE